jgi:NAD(P)-dependent dehydrogenase (short-subunit alcohol dehydrogenase family)
MKTIVITGSTRGIGFGLAAAFLEMGCAVVVSGRTQETVEHAVNELSLQHSQENILGVACDVTVFTQVENLWAEAKKCFGQVDIWINNAGIANGLRPFWEVPADEFQSILLTNLVGAYYGAKVAMTGMLEQGFGSIYNMEGMGSDGKRMVKGLAPYGMTKAALAYFTNAMVDEASGTPVIIGAIRPGMVATEMITNQYRGKEADWERVRGIMNILSDRVETVAPGLARKILGNTRSGIRIKHGSSFKLMGRFLMAPFHTRDVFSK